MYRALILRRFPVYPNVKMNNLYVCFISLAYFGTNRLEVCFWGWYRKRKQFNKTTGKVSLWIIANFLLSFYAFHLWIMLAIQFNVKFRLLGKQQFLFDFTSVKVLYALSLFIFNPDLIYNWKVSSSGT